MAYRKTSVEGEVVMAEGLPKIKHVVQYLAKPGGAIEGAVPVAALDAFMSQWIEKGYKLADTHYLGETPAGFGLLYIFTL